MLGCAILTGPHVDNFRDTYRHLRQRGAVRTIDSPDALLSSVDLLLSDDRARGDMIEAGFAAVGEMRGALVKTMKGLERYLAPLTLEARFSAKPRPRSIAQQNKPMVLRESSLHSDARKAVR